MITVDIPTALRNQTNGEPTIEVDAANIQEMLNGIETQFPDLHGKMVKDGELNRYINIYVGDEDIRFLTNLDTPITEGDSVAIVPAIAGG